VALALLPRPFKSYEVLPRENEMSKRISFLHQADINGAMYSSQSNEMVIGGMVDLKKKTVTLIRASDLKKFVLPFSEFTPSGDGTKPDFTDFQITDCGFSIRFGDYEAGADSCLPRVRKT
jgi:hypothetical protein